MSKILASIADAEAYATWIEANCKPGTHHGVRETATAARAEHAEIVEAARALRSPHLNHGQVHGNEIRLVFCTPEDAQSFMAALNSLDSLLSRFGGGA